MKLLKKEKELSKAIRDAAIARIKLDAARFAVAEALAAVRVSVRKALVAGEAAKRAKEKHNAAIRRLRRYG